MYSFFFGVMMLSMCLFVVLLVVGNEDRVKDKWFRLCFHGAVKHTENL